MIDFEETHQIQNNLNYPLKFPINFESPAKRRCLVRDVCDGYTLSWEYVIDQILS